jgi:hypothetical protein
VVSPNLSSTTGSRTAAYLVAGALATFPGMFLLVGFFGPYGALGGAVVAWTSGIVWLLKRRQEDPAWDRRPVVRRR